MDVNNGFKAYRREIIEDPYLKLYGDFHRFIPVIAESRGFRVTEIKVHHNPRQFGVSKFGARRFAPVPAQAAPRAPVEAREWAAAPENAWCDHVRRYP